MALEDTDLAPGQRIRLEGENLEIRGVLRDSGFNSYLVVGTADNHVCALLPQSVAVEEADPVDPDEDVTDEPGVTDTPGDTFPQENPTPTPTPGPQPGA